MHSLSNDLTNKWRLYLYAIVISFYLYIFIVNPAIIWYENTYARQIPFFIKIPSILTLYQVILKFHDKFLWKFTSLSFIIPTLPNLNGNWDVNIESSYPVSIKGNATIKHDYSHFLMTLETDDSRSMTCLAAMCIKEEPKEIVYTFESWPTSTTKSTMHTHQGTAHLILTKNLEEINGTYYNGRDRKNHGKIVFKKRD